MGWSSAELPGESWQPAFFFILGYTEATNRPLKSTACSSVHVLQAHPRNKQLCGRKASLSVGQV